MTGGRTATGGQDRFSSARLGKLLRRVRQRRRTAKDAVEIASLPAGWAQKNKDVTGSLERLLGAMRKAEERQKIREYTPRTDILEEDKLGLQ